MDTLGIKFTDRGDGEELIDTKLGVVHSTDNRLQPSKVCLQLLIWDIGLLIMR